MTDAPEYAPGTPNYVDLASPDAEASKAFYGGLFGWEAGDGDPQYGNYSLFLLDGKNVAGLGPTMSPNQPPAWLTYVATDNADATTEKVRNAGGQVVMGPMDVGDMLRMAIYTDPTGAFFAVLQPGTYRGAEVVNQTGSFSWNELATRDMPRAKAFYHAVFGWDADTDDSMAGPYTTWKLNDRAIGGGRVMGDQEPADRPPHWLTYFNVENCDAAVSKAQELGATVLAPSMDIEIGQMAVLQDPQGAVFAVFAPKQ